MATIQYGRTVDGVWVPDGPELPCVVRVLADDGVPDVVLPDAAAPVPADAGPVRLGRVVADLRRGE